MVNVGSPLYSRLAKFLAIKSKKKAICQRGLYQNNKSIKQLNLSKKMLNISSKDKAEGYHFKVVTRQGRNRILEDHSKRPSLGQYNPIYTLTQPRYFSPYLRKTELDVTFGGYLCVVESNAKPKKICKRME